LAARLSFQGERRLGNLRSVRACLFAREMRSNGWILDEVDALKMEGDKAGNFDWILDWDAMQRYLYAWRSRRGDGPQLSTALVIGCGTSSLSFKLRELGWFSVVVSIDNDPGCVAHMQQQHAGDSGMEWYVYDVVERSGSAAFAAASGQAFDLIVDKGTLDAVLVEGVCWPMLCEVHRMLAPSGHYLLCSIHSQGLLLPLLGTPILGLDVEHLEDLSLIAGGSGEEGCSLLLHKAGICDGGPATVDEAALASHEKEVMDFFYQEEQPLLTDAFVAEAEVKFAAALQVRREAGWVRASLPLAEVHALLFGGEREQALGYTLALFLEDAANTSTQPAVSGELTLREALDLLRDVQ